MRQYERNLKTKQLTHGVVIKFVKEFARNAEFVKSRGYMSLFPSRLNSRADAELIQQIETRTEEMAEAPFTESMPFSLELMMI